MDTSAIILSNVSAVALGTARQESLASYVRDQGGGLIVVGGDQAFSVGGYARTPLEEILPVETSRAKLKFLSLSMVIVIDRSGSMAGEKIAMARDGGDRLGRIAQSAGLRGRRCVRQRRPVDRATSAGQQPCRDHAASGSDRQWRRHKHVPGPWSKRWQRCSE